MGSFEGKRGLIFGVANKNSIAWGIAQALAEEGATLGFSYAGEALQKRVALLADGWRTPRNPQEFHLRRAYALADLYDRGGDQPAARRLFAWIDRHSPGYADATDRLADLSA